MKLLENLNQHKYLWDNFFCSSSLPFPSLWDFWGADQGFHANLGLEQGFKPMTKDKQKKLPLGGFGWLSRGDKY